MARCSTAANWWWGRRTWNISLPGVSASNRTSWPPSESELAASPVCPHCGYKPASEALPFVIAANALSRLDEELDGFLAAWQESLLDLLEDPFTQASLDLLKDTARQLVQDFLDSRSLPEPITPEFVSAVQEALSGLEEVIVTGEDIQRALLTGGSPATPDGLRKRFDALLNERCKGKDVSKLRFVID